MSIPCGHYFGQKCVIERFGVGSKETYPGCPVCHRQPHEVLMKGSAAFLPRSQSVGKTAGSVKRKRSRLISVTFDQLRQAVDHVLVEYDALVKKRDFAVWAEVFDHPDLRWMRWLLRFHLQWEKSRHPPYLKRIARWFSWRSLENDATKQSAMSHLRKHFRDTKTITTKEFQMNQSYPINHLSGLVRGWIHQVIEDWKLELLSIKMIPKGFRWNRQSSFEEATVAKVLAKAMELTGNTDTDAKQAMVKI